MLQVIDELEQGNNIDPDDIDFLKNSASKLEGSSPVLKNNTTILKTNLSTIIELYQNFKKQAELKK